MNKTYEDFRLPENVNWQTGLPDERYWGEYLLAYIDGTALPSYQLAEVRDGGWVVEAWDDASIPANYVRCWMPLPMPLGWSPAK